MAELGVDCKKRVTSSTSVQRLLWEENERDAGCPPSPRCVSRGLCQRSASGSLLGDVPAAVREGSTAELLPGVPPLLSPSFALQACSGRRGSKLPAAVPRHGKPTRQHSPILTPSLPAPCSLPPTCPSAGTSQWPFAEGAQAAVPHRGPPPLPQALAVSRPLSSPHSCPPQPGRTVP